MASTGKGFGSFAGFDQQTAGGEEGRRPTAPSKHSERPNVAKEPQMDNVKDADEQVVGDLKFDHPTGHI